MKTICTFLLALTLCLGAAPAAWSAPTETPQAASAPQKDKPASVGLRVTSISVALEGTDSIGSRLGMKLKEAFNASNLFKLDEGDAPKMKLLVATSPEFVSRPGVGSVYSITWVFSQGEGYLPFLLAREHGTLNVEEIDALVAKLMERTDGLAVKYAGLWKDTK